MGTAVTVGISAGTARAASAADEPPASPIPLGRGSGLPGSARRSPGPARAGSLPAEPDVVTSSGARDDLLAGETPKLH